MMRFGDELRRARSRAGMSLRGLARATAVSPAHICDIELNRRMPSLDLYRKIMRVLPGPERGANGAKRWLESCWHNRKCPVCRQRMPDAK